MNGRAVILKPMINEKSMALVKLGFYTFAVDGSATKDRVAKVVSEKFKVDVTAVQIVNIKGKVKNQRARRRQYSMPDVKKAIVKLKSGQRISIFEMPTEVGQDVEVRTAEGEPVTKIKEKKSLLKGTKVKIEKSEETGKETKQKEEPRKSAKTTGKKKGES